MARRGRDAATAAPSRSTRALVRPTPLQQPRPPVWLGCVWPNRRPLVRAARYDGVFPVSHDGDARPATTCAPCSRSSPSTVPPDAGPFDVVLVNHERPDPERLAELGAAGATWWLQGFGERPRLADVRDAAAAGPPQ